MGLTKQLFHPLPLFVTYSGALIGSFMLTVHLWERNGVFASANVAQPISKTHLIATYGVGVLVILWITVAIQTFTVWFVTRFSASSETFGSIWKIVFWTFLIPQTAHGIITNLLLSMAGKPFSVSFGLALLTPVPKWVDLVTDVCLLAQLVLFFYYVGRRFEPHSGVVLGGLAVGRLVAGFLF